MPITVQIKNPSISGVNVVTQVTAAFSAASYPIKVRVVNLSDRKDAFPVVEGIAIPPHDDNTNDYTATKKINLASASDMTNLATNISRITAKLSDVDVQFVIEEIAIGSTVDTWAASWKQGVEWYGDIFTSTNKPIAAAFGRFQAWISDLEIFEYSDGSNWVVPTAPASSSVVVSSVAVRAATIDGHALIRTVTPITGTRIHQEPNGNPSGTAAKYDFMLDPYDSGLGGDAANYRIGNIVAKTHDPSDTGTQQGSSGVFLIAAKSAGHTWGCWPSIQMGFQDGSVGAATPFKMMYFDTADTVWYTPMLGAWRTGMAVAIGDYVTYNNKIYQAATAGTTGATAPAHATGTVTDGAVDWLWIRTPSIGNIKGCVVIGDLESKPKFGFPNVRLQVAKDMLVQNSNAVVFEDNASAQSWKAYTPSGGSDLRIEYDSTHYVRFSKTSKFVTHFGLAKTTSTLADTSGVVNPTVVGTECLVLTPAAPLSVTSFAGRLPNQMFFVEAGNGDVTLVHGSTIKLRGGVNYTMTVDDCLLFKVDGSGASAKQVI